MDEKNGSSRNLADIMNLSISAIQNVVAQHPHADVTIKADGSPVTKLDLALSALVESCVREHLPDHNFYSEENFQAWSFPMVVVDPLDGTKEYVRGTPEWAISVAQLLTTDMSGEGWVYNPLTQELYSSGEGRKFAPKEKYQGEVSRTEWEQGLFNKISDVAFELSPMGSIAYKLGRLSAGKIDFVISLRPKNIWDIAAGTILCQQAGLVFYAQGKEVVSVQQKYQPPLIWCAPELFPQLSKLFP